MIFDGSQRFLINEFAKILKFYKLYPIELNVRMLTKQSTNAYIITFVACCKEIFAWTQHGVCEGANSKMQAILKFGFKKKQQEAL